MSKFFYPFILAASVFDFERLSYINIRFLSGGSLSIRRNSRSKLKRILYKDTSIGMNNVSNT